MKIIGTAILLAAAIFPRIVVAESVHSVSSIRILCASETNEVYYLCKSYIRGIVETWMLKDLVGVNPYRYASRENTPTFCDAIGRVSVDELARIVTSELPDMQDDFASRAIMKALSKRLCE